MTDSLYATSFSLKTLDHLGINLYGHAPAVIAELVANSHDAGARRVDITISPGKIVVQDDGIGMLLSDINTKYLRFGYDKRKEITTIPVTSGDHTIQRHVMGRKGIGKISTLSVSREIEIQTARGSERNGFIIKLEDIRKLQEQNSTEYWPEPVPSRDITISQGTRIELRQLVEQVTGLNDALRVSLARVFPNTGDEVLFNIYVNDKPITLEDRTWFNNVQFMWYFGEESKKFIDYCPRLEKSFLVGNVLDLARGYTITGWLATTFTPSDVTVDQKIVPVYAHDKLIQRDLLYDYKNYKLSSAYLIGEIYASFIDLDTEPDIVLSDRQRINPNDPRYISLRQHVVQQVEGIDKGWNALRGESPNRRVRKKKTEASHSPPEAPEQSGLFDHNTDQDAINGSATPPTEASTHAAGNSGNTNNNGADGSQNGQSASTPAAEDANAQAPNRGVRPHPPAREASAIFGNIRTAIDGSSLEQEFKRIMLYDLEQARLSYNCGAFKACVIMLGAVVEGLMLGTLRRPDLMDLMINDTTPPAVVARLGTRNPAFADRRVFANHIADRLDFDSFRNILQHYIEATQHLGINEVQRFRNAIHPWRCVSNSAVYGEYGPARALTHLASLEPLARFVLAWTP